MTFCKQYKCTAARIGNHNKYRYQSDRPHLWAPERLQLHLDAKFEQLKVAVDLQHWRKAFYSIEDIHGLMCKVKKTPKPSLLVVYYAKLTEIFWISSSHLYHAYAWFKLFTLLQKTYPKNLSLKDLQPIASSAVLAALLVVPYDCNRSACASPLELENEKERNLRMANPIGFEIDPKLDNRVVLSRPSLLSELVSNGVVSCATQEVKDLYNLFEHEFLPLGLATKAQTLLVKISKLGGKLASASPVPEVQLSRYVPALEKIVTLKQLQQLSQVYQVIKIESLFSSIPFFDDFSIVERISLEAAKHNFLSLKIDHMRGVVIFGSESVGLRNHLTTFAESLYKLRAMIVCPPASKLILSGLGEAVDKEHKRYLARKSIIEERKLKECESQLVEMEREEESRRQKKTTEEVEQKRIAAEFEQKKNQMIVREVEEAQTQALLQGNSKGKEAKEEIEKKLQKMAKKMDYLERAKREEAIPFMEAFFQRRLEEEVLLHKREQQLEVELSRQRRDRDLEEKNRLSRILENKNIFQERVLRSVEDRRKVEREERIKLFIQARKQEREVKRKKIVYVRSEEDRIRKLSEEEEAHKREEAEGRRKEEATRKAKLDEWAEKQRQREREVEEKQQNGRGALLRRSSARASELRIVAPPSPSGAKYVPPQLRGKAECYS